MDFSRIQDFDMQLLHVFNGSENVWLDQMAMALTSGWTWIPLYVVLFVVVIRNNEMMGQIALVVGRFRNFSRIISFSRVVRISFSSCTWSILRILLRSFHSSFHFSYLSRYCVQLLQLLPVQQVLQPVFPFFMPLPLLLHSELLLLYTDEPTAR